MIPNSMNVQNINHPGSPTVQNSEHANIQYQVILVKDPPRSLEHYPAQHSIVLGGIQIGCGLILIAFGIAAIFYSALGSVGHGIWGGAPPIAGGIIGILAAVLKLRAMVITNLVMATVSASIAAGPFAAAVVGAVTDDEHYGYYYHSNKRGVGLESIIAVVLIVQSVASIWAAAISCQFVCGRSCRECCCTCYNEGESSKSTPLLTGSFVNPMRIGNTNPYVPMPNVVYSTTNQEINWPGYLIQPVNALNSSDTSRELNAAVMVPPTYHSHTPTYPSPQYVETANHFNGRY